MHIPALPVFALLLLEQGCAPSVRLPRPDVRVPPAFEVAAPAGEGALSLDRWWDGFDDPQLAQLVAAALERSTTARLAYARIIEARATRAQTRATTLPSGSVSASATEQGSERLSGNGLSQPGSATYQASFYPSWELDLFGRLAAIRERADLDYRASALDFYGARLALAGDVAAALFQARYLAVQLEDARETLRIARELARSGELGQAHGLTSGQDVARLEADRASAEAEAVRLEGELHAAKRSLLILIGDPTAATDTLAIEPALATPPALPAATPGLLLARRPDVRRAQIALASAARSIEIDRLALFPRFTIEPGAGLTATSGGATGLWSLAAGLTLPVLDRTRLLATLRITEARGREAVISYEQAVQTAFGEAENALTRVDAGRRRLGDLARATERARYAFDAARRGYAAGLTDLTTLLQAERTWLQNRATLNAARFGLLSDTVTAIRALGGGWDPQAGLGPNAPLPPVASNREAP
jgi:NodT family efflux transporter outer membrane factor (OMF) lipoprotein